MAQKFPTVAYGHNLDIIPNNILTLCKHGMVSHWFTSSVHDCTIMAVCQNLVPPVNIKIAGKWMFIPLKMVLIGIDPTPYPTNPPFFLLNSAFKHLIPKLYEVLGSVHKGGVRELRLQGVTQGTRSNKQWSLGRDNHLRRETEHHAMEGVQTLETPPKMKHHTLL